MKKITILLAGMTVFALLAGCGAGGQTKQQETAGDGKAQSAYHKITAEEAKQMMDGQTVTIVDVREPDEYEAAHVTHAISVPNEEIETSQPEALPDLDAVLLVYCRTGVRSKDASEKLVDIGYTNVYDFGGIVDWPYDTETGA